MALQVVRLARTMAQYHPKATNLTMEETPLSLEVPDWAHMKPRSTMTVPLLGLLRILSQFINLLLSS
jgi:hypothetical protein